MQNPQREATGQKRRKTAGSADRRERRFSHRKIRRLPTAARAQREGVGRDVASSRAVTEAEADLQRTGSRVEQIHPDGGHSIGEVVRVPLALIENSQLPETAPTVCDRLQVRVACTRGASACDDRKVGRIRDPLLPVVERAREGVGGTDRDGESRRRESHHGHRHRTQTPDPRHVRCSREGRNTHPRLNAAV